MRTSLVNIARRLELSPSTVSRALNDYSDVASDTRELVQRAALKLDYQPSSAARDLRRGRTDRIATAIETVLAQPDLMRKPAEIRRRELLATDAGAARIRIAGGCGAAPSGRQRGKRVAHYIFRRRQSMR